jgi:hypothetical protein
MKQLTLFDLKDTTHKQGRYFSVVRHASGELEITAHRTQSEAFEHCYETEEMKAITGSEVRGPRGGLLAIVRGRTGVKWRKRKKVSKDTRERYIEHK